MFAVVAADAMTTYSEPPNMLLTPVQILSSSRTSNGQLMRNSDKADKRKNGMIAKAYRPNGEPSMPKALKGTSANAQPLYPS